MSSNWTHIAAHAVKHALETERGKQAVRAVVATAAPVVVAATVAAAPVVATGAAVAGTVWAARKLAHWFGRG